MSFNALRSLISKNMKMFFRSKISASAVILIPLVVVILSGIAFDSSSLSNINVGVYSEEYSQFTEDIITDFEEQGFGASRYDTSEACINSVRHSETQICVIFPAGLSPDVSTEDIVFYADYSRVNLASELVSQIETSVGIKTSGVSEGLAQDLINSLQSVKDTLPQNAENVKKALNDAKDNQEMTDSIDFPVEDIGTAILDLIDLKEKVNVSAPALNDDVQDIIDNLQDINESSKLLLADLEGMSSDQGQLISSLTSASNSLDSLIVVLGAQRDIAASDVVSPIETRIEPITSDSSNKDYMIPIIIGLIAMFGSILLSSTMVLREKKTKAFFRNFMAPVNNVVFILSTYLTCLFILFIQFFFIVMGIEWVLNMNILPAVGPLILILFVALSVFTGLGMLIGYLFRTEETVIFASMIIASLLMFFSNAILPLENIATGFMSILNFSPLVISNLAIKKVVLFNLGLGDIWTHILILFGYAVVLFGANTYLRNLTRRIKQS